MSDFSPLSIFKSQAKQLARDQGLKLSTAQETLVQKAGFADYHEFSVVAQRNPNDPRLMAAVFGVKDFSEAIHEDDVYADLDEEFEDQLSGAIAETNASEFTIGTLEVDSAEYDETTGVLSLGISLTYQGQQDQERMYHGTAFFLTARVELLRRNGKWLLAEEGVSISSSESDADRDRRSEWETSKVTHPRPRTCDYVVMKGSQRGVEFIGILEAKLSVTNPKGLDLQCFVQGRGGVYGLPFPLWFVAEFDGDMIEEALTSDGVNWVASVEELKSFDRVQLLSILDKTELLHFTLENSECSKLKADLTELLYAQSPA